jgi:hypothetical protein
MRNFFGLSLDWRIGLIVLFISLNFSLRNKNITFKKSLFFLLPFHLQNVFPMFLEITNVLNVCSILYWAEIWKKSERWRHIINVIICYHMLWHTSVISCLFLLKQEHADKVLRISRWKRVFSFSLLPLKKNCPCLCLCLHVAVMATLL